MRRCSGIQVAAVVVTLLAAVAAGQSAYNEPEWEDADDGQLAENSREGRFISTHLDLIEAASSMLPTFLPLKGKRGRIRRRKIFANERSDTGVEDSSEDEGASDPDTTTEVGGTTLDSDNVDAPSDSFPPIGMPAVPAVDAADDVADEEEPAIFESSSSTEIDSDENENIQLGVEGREAVLEPFEHESDLRESNTIKEMGDNLMILESFGTKLTEEKKNKKEDSSSKTPQQPPYRKLYNPTVLKYPKPEGTPVPLVIICEDPNYCPPPGTPYGNYGGYGNYGPSYGEETYNKPTEKPVIRKYGIRRKTTTPSPEVTPEEESVPVYRPSPPAPRPTRPANVYAPFTDSLPPVYTPSEQITRRPIFKKYGYNPKKQAGSLFRQEVLKIRKEQQNDQEEDISIQENENNPVNNGQQLRVPVDSGDSSLDSVPIIREEDIDHMSMDELRDFIRKTTNVMAEAQAPTQPEPPRVPVMNEQDKEEMMAEIKAEMKAEMLNEVTVVNEEGKPIIDQEKLVLMTGLDEEEADNIGSGISTEELIALKQKMDLVDIVAMENRMAAAQIEDMVEQMTAEEIVEEHPEMEIEDVVALKNDLTLEEMVAFKNEMPVEEVEKLVEMVDFTDIMLLKDGLSKDEAEAVVDGAVSVEQLIEEKQEAREAPTTSTTTTTTPRTTTTRRTTTLPPRRTTSPPSGSLLEMMLKNLKEKEKMKEAMDSKRTNPFRMKVRRPSATASSQESINETEEDDDTVENDFMSFDSISGFDDSSFGLKQGVNNLDLVLEPTPAVPGRPVTQDMTFFGGENRERPTPTTTSRPVVVRNRVRNRFNEFLPSPGTTAPPLIPVINLQTGDFSFDDDSAPPITGGNDVPAANVDGGLGNFPQDKMPIFQNFPMQDDEKVQFTLVNDDIPQMIPDPIEYDIVEDDMPDYGMAAMFEPQRPKAVPTAPRASTTPQPAFVAFPSARPTNVEAINPPASVPRRPPVFNSAPKMPDFSKPSPTRLPDFADPFGSFPGNSQFVPNSGLSTIKLGSSSMAQKISEFMGTPMLKPGQFVNLEPEEESVDPSKAVLPEINIKMELPEPVRPTFSSSPSTPFTVPVTSGLPNPRPTFKATLEPLKLVTTPAPTTTTTPAPPAPAVDGQDELDSFINLLNPDSPSLDAIGEDRPQRHPRPRPRPFVDLGEEAEYGGHSVYHPNHKYPRPGFSTPKPFTARPRTTIVPKTYTKIGLKNKDKTGFGDFGSTIPGFNNDDGLLPLFKEIPTDLALDQQRVTKGTNDHLMPFVDLGTEYKDGYGASSLVDFNDPSYKGVAFYQQYGQHDDRPSVFHTKSSEENYDYYEDDLSEYDYGDVPKIKETKETEKEKDGEIRYGGLAFVLPPPGKFQSKKTKPEQPKLKVVEKPKTAKGPTVSSVYPNHPVSSVFPNKPVSEVFRDEPETSFGFDGFGGSGLSIIDSKKPELDMPSFENFFKISEKFLDNPFGKSFVKLEIDKDKYGSNKSAPTVHHIPLEPHPVKKVPLINVEDELLSSPEIDDERDQSRPKKRKVLYRPPPVITEYEPLVKRDYKKQMPQESTQVFRRKAGKPEIPFPTVANIPSFMKSLVGKPSDWVQRAWKGRDEASARSIDFDNFDIEELSK